ncbi:hypothetical protein CNE_BB1p05500 (plasmid) [Cupriavidus necator N-1]|uniref:Uncharacterized protein n=1 Tax=Cupriavidus necator (strain ATCC 43291 / DSM 13513 / CCUG 52238 / LMG 8453 / N-1) TaxID=1042878 RepID=F8GXA0_CUPNN|nr:hypothetical protein CNE_BB1p05500 [Cupriavidus necator N-1]
MWRGRGGHARFRPLDEFEDGHASHHRRHKANGLRIASAQSNQRGTRAEAGQTPADAEGGAAQYQPKRYGRTGRQLHRQPQEGVLAVFGDEKGERRLASPR